MPNWIWVVLGGLGLLWLTSRGQASIPIPAGATQYKVVDAGAKYYSSDPSLGSGLANQPVTVQGTIPGGSVVYATTPNNAAPQLSSDQTYELIIAPGIGQVWVSISDIRVA